MFNLNAIAGRTVCSAIGPIGPISFSALLNIVLRAIKNKLKNS